MVDYLITSITNKQDLLLRENIIYPEWKRLWVNFFEVHWSQNLV